MNVLLTGRRSVITTALCAVFAFLGWLASLNGPSSLAISLYVLAFVVGGSEKAFQGLSVVDPKNWARIRAWLPRRRSFRHARRTR